MMSYSQGCVTTAGDGRPAYLIPGNEGARPRRHTSVNERDRKRPGHVSRARSASNILQAQSTAHDQLYTPDIATNLRRRSTQDDLGDLIDFLKNHAPPPDNFMSIPEDDDEGDRGRWLKWTKFSKRSKSAPRAPPQIRLPDTAVSGKTTGGHRHIAITIPLEASPMGQRPRSQYPVYDPKHTKPVVTNRGPVRTFVNERGVITVLKTVTEGKEASPPLSRNTSHPYAQSRTRATSRGPQPALQGFLAPPSRGANMMQTGESSSRQHVSGRPVSPQPALGNYPRRVSSVGNRPLHTHISIDGLLSQHQNLDGRPTKSRDGSQAHHNSRPATANLGDLGQKLEVENAKVTMSQAPDNRTSWRRKANANQLSDIILPMDNPLGSRSNRHHDGHDESEPSTPNSTKSRRDRVRDRKRRDMEALRNAKLKKQGEISDSEGSISSGWMKDVTKHQPSLSPIQVVMNVEPCLTPLDAPKRLSSASTSTAAHSEAEKPVEPAAKSSATLLPAFNGSSNPTPPLSPNESGGYKKKHHSLDRASLSRRREWNAHRDQERKAIEARAAVRVKAKKLAARINGEEPCEHPHSLDREILRLYEAYRDQRFREMERRVRRLERNGDVWLRALVPVLENLNRNMVSSMHGQIEDRAWMSDDEPTATSRQTHRRRATMPMRPRADSAHPTSPRDPREANLAQRMEELTNPESDRRRESVASDESGLEMLEPLMRELAGAARLRQMRSAELPRHHH